jgi:predicted regulator of Ras-like GTPase activity (Roadblock/LC7/MglB family)
MTMQGSLHDMTVADLIQHNCMDRKTAQLVLHDAGKNATLFFNHGKVIHAEFGMQQGEEVVYAVLGWEDGNFDLITGVKPPHQTIDRNWSSLLLEGARRLDESNHISDAEHNPQPGDSEVYKMAQKLDEILKEMGSEVNGYIGSVIVGMDGMDIAQDLHTKVNADVFSAQLTMLIKLVDTSAAKLAAGGVEDNLMTTKDAYMLMHFLPEKQFFLGVMAERKTCNLGNLRLISRMYGNRISKAMPR